MKSIRDYIKEILIGKKVRICNDIYEILEITSYSPYSEFLGYGISFRAKSKNKFGLIEEIEFEDWDLLDE